MNHITADVHDLVRQAGDTAADYMHAAIRHIDQKFGPGYAAANPVLLGAFMQAAASDFAANMAAAVAQDSSMNVGAISDALDRVARAIADRD